nr:hypothetical protein [Nostoc sp. EkiNYC01]
MILTQDELKRLFTKEFLSLRDRLRRVKQRHRILFGITQMSSSTGNLP